MFICPNVHLAECSFGRMFICPNVHLSEVHLAEYSFGRMLNSINILCPDAIQEGCLFHFFLDLWRNWSKASLTNVCIKYEQWREGFRMVMGLPFLPTNFVRRGFWLILQVMENVDDNLKVFLHYVAQTYIGLCPNEDVNSFNPKVKNYMASLQASTSSLPSFGTLSTSLSALRASTPADNTSVNNESLSLSSINESAMAQLGTETTIDQTKIEKETVAEEPLFPLFFWNVQKRASSALARLNNAIEESNTMVTARCGEIVKLEEFIKLVLEFDGKARINPPPKRPSKNKYLLDEHLLRLVEEFDGSDDSSILTFLRRCSFCFVRLSTKLSDGEGMVTNV